MFRQGKNRVYEITKCLITTKLCESLVVTNAIKHDYGQV